MSWQWYICDAIWRMDHWKKEWTDSDYNKTIIETFYDVSVEKRHEAAHGGFGVGRSLAEGLRMRQRWTENDTFNL
jgi:hypothetical protein